MTRIVSMAAAERIWSAHREIEAANKLLDDIKETLKEGRPATPIDRWGRHRAFQFGVPSGDSGHRLLDVSPRLALCVVEAHIAEKQRELVEASIEAYLELETED